MQQRRERASGAAEDLWLRYWSTRRLVLSRASNRQPYALSRASNRQPYALSGASNRQPYALSGARPAPGLGPWRRLRRPGPPAVR